MNTTAVNQDHYPKIKFVRQAKGPTLGLAEQSGANILQENGLLFKDLNKDGKLDKYEDWRLSPEERAQDLASKMTIEQIAGLMLHSSHQALPVPPWSRDTYDGKSYQQSGAKPYDLTDQQIDYVTKTHMRHMLVTSVESPRAAAIWNNKLQALAESVGLGIPANNSSDPRHSVDSSKEFNAGAGGTISMWPESLGLAASFDPEIARKFGLVAAKEYRALGVATALSPQIDLATDPRWMRLNMTFGDDPQLAADMTRAYVDGFQTSAGEQEIAAGWGFDSVHAMVKHWPGGGSGEGGRDAHFGYGKFAVYPGNNFAQHLVPFLEGAFKLDGPTEQASAVMPYYSISYAQDIKNGENVGNSYSSYLIQDLLRNKYGYDNVVCTDWGITEDPPTDMEKLFPGERSWGVEDGYSVAERHYKLLMAGVDQFGGNTKIEPILAAYEIGVKEHGEAYMRQRFEQSAVRLLKNIFRVGLFENPYIQPEDAEKTVGAPEFVKEGYEAQLKSIVLLKNEKQVLPLQKRSKVYIPKQYRPSGINWVGYPDPEISHYPVNLDIAAQYYEIVDKPEEADAGLVFIESPYTTYGYSKADADNGGNGYVPISLQYGAYTAEHARETSIAIDPRDGTNRSYQGKTVTARNSSDLDMILDTKRLLGGKPVIVVIDMKNPTVMSEFEQSADAIVACFGVQDQAVLDIVSGAVEPSALLPMQMPANMRTVEEQYEDVPHDMEVYVDAAGNRYDFAFGLNWNGVIQDERVMKYKLQV